MSADRNPDEDLLASISDGKPADWTAAEQAAGAQGRARLESLHELSRIADFNRGLQRTAKGTAEPERWGDLVLLERLGASAHAEVFRAWDPALRREVALKLMRAETQDSALLEEGRTAARIRHAHVVTVHGIDRRDGRVGLWMELLRGPTLEQQVRAQGPLDPAAARQLGLEIGGALAAVHAAGLLHRDIKPANIVRDPERGLVLADFGLGRRWDQAVEHAGPSGTPMYMAPELFAGSPASERADLYSLGLLLWFALVGRHPFETDSLAALTAMSRQGPRPALRERKPDVPAALAAIVGRAMAPEPAERFASTQSMVDALDAWRPGRAAPARRPALAAAVFVTLVALGVVAFVAWRARRSEVTEPAGGATPAAAPVAIYSVEASFLRRDGEGATRLIAGDRVKPGDRLSLEVRASRPAWIYVLNEDERGERYLLFPQPRFDARNPLPAESTFTLPGTVGGKENAWTVTSAGGREHFLVVASPEPVLEIEAELDRLPAPTPGQTIDYARVGDVAVERLRGVGGVTELPPDAARPSPTSAAFDRFRALAGRENGIRGVWVRQIVLENPRR
ncbi:MAG: serine/threonine-protein kinase [Candidatus Eisenbacteria bacterium]